MDDELLIDKHQVEKGVTAILKYVEKTEKKDLSASLEPELIRLQLGYKKIPAVKNMIVKIDLPVSLLLDTSEVALFVKDENENDRDYSPTVRHYEEKLAAAGIKNVKIVPLKCVKLEYKEFEAKRNLSNMYDVFLADERIVRLLPRLLGKSFYARKKYPLQVNLLARDLKKEINRALSRTQCIMSGRGSNCGVTVANSRMTVQQITANVEETVQKVTSVLPGGRNNVKNIHIKSLNSPSLPLYVNLGKTKDVILPKRREREPSPEPEDVTTVESGLVKVSKYGRISIIPYGESRKPSHQDDHAPDESNTDESDLESEDIDEASDSDDAPTEKKSKIQQNKKTKTKLDQSSAPPKKKMKIQNTEDIENDDSLDDSEENLESNKILTKSTKKVTATNKNSKGRNNPKELKKKKSNPFSEETTMKDSKKLQMKASIKVAKGKKMRSSDGKAKKHAKSRG